MEKFPMSAASMSRQKIGAYLRLHLDKRRKVKVLLGYIPNYKYNAKSLACDTANVHALT